jgi:transposase
MADLLPMFKSVNEVETSCKTIERTYSDLLVRIIIHNMFVILIKRKRIKQVDFIGDGTGYGLTITKNYRTVREKQAKNSNSGHKSNNSETKTKQESRQLFTYAFALMDLDSGMYVGYGASLKSERDTFGKALVIMHKCGVEVRSIRLDQYYSGQSTADFFGNDVLLYVIPKSNATISGSHVWKDMVRDFMMYPFLFLKEYFRREHSESGFSADKRCDVLRVWQRRDDRIGTATMCKGIWQNFFRLGG